MPNAMPTQSSEDTCILYNQMGLGDEGADHAQLLKITLLSSHDEFSSSLTKQTVLYVFSYIEDTWFQLDLDMLPLLLSLLGAARAQLHVYGPVPGLAPSPSLAWRLAEDSGMPRSFPSLDVLCAAAQMRVRQTATKFAPFFG